MLLTFFIDPPLVLFFGFIFAFALPMTARVAIGSSRALKGGLVTMTIFNCAVMLSYLWYPDWMWMYLFRASDLGTIGHLITIIVGLAAYYVFFLMGFYWGIKRRTSGIEKPWIMAIILLVLSGFLIIPVFDQYWHVGSHAAYLAGTAIPLPQSRIAALLNTVISAMVVIGGLLFWWARRERV